MILGYGQDMTMIETNLNGILVGESSEAIELMSPGEKMSMNETDGGVIFAIGSEANLTEVNRFERNFCGHNVTIVCRKGAAGEAVLITPLSNESISVADGAGEDLWIDLCQNQINLL